MEFKVTEIFTLLCAHLQSLASDSGTPAGVATPSFPKIPIEFILIDAVLVLNHNAAPL